MTAESDPFHELDLQQAIDLRWTLRDIKAKRWKLSPSDFEDRTYWGDYVKAYQDALARCSTDVAPWYIVPADRKWVRNFAVSGILVETLEACRMKFPKPTFDVSRLKAAL